MSLRLHSNNDNPPLNGSRHPRAQHVERGTAAEIRKAQALRRRLVCRAARASHPPASAYHAPTRHPLPLVPSTIPHFSASSQPPPKLSLPEGYTAVVRWGQGDVLVLYGSDYVPPDPRSSPSDRFITGEDGYWGPQPYDQFSQHLALLEVPTTPEVKQALVFRAPLDEDHELWHPASDTDAMPVRRDNLFVVKESVHHQLYKRTRYLRDLFADAVALLRQT